MRAIIVLILACIFLIGCSDAVSVVQKTKDLEVGFTVSGCANTRELFKADSPLPVVVAENSYLKLTHRLNVNCCKNVSVFAATKSNIVSITELHEGYACRCVCESDVESTIGPFKAGTYEVSVYRQDFSYKDEKDLLFSVNLTV